MICPVECSFFRWQGFRKYLHQARDHDELLSFLLGGIIKDRMRFAQLGARGRGGAGAGADLGTITVPVLELENRAKELDVYDVRPFLSSRLFAANGYVWNETDRTVAKHFGNAGGAQL